MPYHILHSEAGRNLADRWPQENGWSRGTVAREQARLAAHLRSVPLERPGWRCWGAPAAGVMCSKRVCVYMAWGKYTYAKKIVISSSSGKCSALYTGISGGEELGWVELSLGGRYFLSLPCWNSSALSFVIIFPFSGCISSYCFRNSCW